MERKMGLVEYLNIEFTKRQDINSSYSLRAFARDLEVHASTLSHIMRGKRKLSTSMRNKLLEKLHLDSADGKLLQESASQRSSYTTHDIEHFIMLSEWYYDAILELTHTKGFIPSAEFVAEKLNIELSIATKAIERLFESGQLKETPNKKWTDNEFHSDLAPGDVSHVALKKLQLQLLDRAKESIVTYNTDVRDQFSTTVSINKKDLEKAKEMISEFRDRMVSFLQRSGREHDEVYELIISFFPHTKLDQD